MYVCTFVSIYVCVYVCELKHFFFVSLLLYRATSLPRYFTASDVTKCHLFKENVTLGGITTYVHFAMGAV